ncbi:MAG: leucyl aminopeptidase family protein [Oscillospiraceae bacterium]|nr:leucyl aminopeptidase family protein [Oscillospiraceae bacterium]
MIQLWNNEPVQWRVELETQKGEPLSLRTAEQGRILIVNLGEKPEPQTVRRAAAKAVKTVQSLGGQSVLFDAAPAAEALGTAGVSALAQGADLACYRQESWKQTPDKPFDAYLTGAEGLDAAAILTETGAVTRAVCFARDLVNCPANLLTPERMAQRMTEAAKPLGIETQVLGEEDTRALNMGAFHAVGDSAGHPPRLIVLRYRGGATDAAPIALVGKGVCCDTGGYCLKTAGGLKGMRGDMAGGAAVCGALLALAENQVPVNAVAVIPAVENRISPDSFLPGDVVTSMSGKTIQVNNTDAEGRLILADAVTYAIEKEGANQVVDIATLTGACVAALGFTTAGLLTNDEGLFLDVMSAAARAGEQYWRFPDFPEYKKMIESPVADLCNQSNDGCGAITAGLFIGAFAEGHPWVHLDIAGTAWVDRPRWEYQVPGATGAGVTTLYELCRGLAQTD